VSGTHLTTFLPREGCVVSQDVVFMVAMIAHCKIWNLCDCCRHNSRHTGRTNDAIHRTTAGWVGTTRTYWLYEVPWLIWIRTEWRKGKFWKIWNLCLWYKCTISNTESCRLSRRGPTNSYFLKKNSVPHLLWNGARS
jgi:hypothetical protein